MRVGLLTGSVAPAAFRRLGQTLDGVEPLKGPSGPVSSSPLFAGRVASWGERRLTKRLERRIVRARGILERARPAAESCARSDLLESWTRIRFEPATSLSADELASVVFRMDRVPRFECDRLRDAFELLAPGWMVTGDRYTRLMHTSRWVYGLLVSAPRRPEIVVPPGQEEFVGFGVFGRDFSNACPLEGIELSEMVLFWSPIAGSEFFEPTAVGEMLRAV